MVQIATALRLTLMDRLTVTVLRKDRHRPIATAVPLFLKNTMKLMAWPHLQESLWISCPATLRISHPISWLTTRMTTQWPKKKKIKRKSTIAIVLPTSTPLCQIENPFPSMFQLLLHRAWQRAYGRSLAVPRRQWARNSLLTVCSADQIWSRASLVYELIIEWFTSTTTLW